MKEMTARILLGVIAIPILSTPPLTQSLWLSRRSPELKPRA